MNNFLQTVILERKRDAQRAGRKMSAANLRRQAAVGAVHRSLKDQWRQHAATDQRLCIIAEVKKASPAAGLLRQDYGPAAIAVEYEKAGAAAISVLTEPRHFLGCDEDLRAVRKMVSLPVLRKDFISQSYQVLESAVMGADIILLITAMLDFRTLTTLYKLATDLGLETIVEVHTREELDRIAPLEEAIIGVNSRNLTTLKTDLSVARRLAPLLPSGRLVIAESGIRDRRDMEELQALGYRGFLIGEALMRAADPGKQLRTFLAPGQS